VSSTSSISTSASAIQPRGSACVYTSLYLNLGDAQANVGDRRVDGLTHRRWCISDRNASRLAHLLAAVGCIAGSVLLVWAAATGAPGLRVPAAVALIVAAVPAAAAWRLLQLWRGVASAGDGAAALVLAAMATFCLWVAVGPGARRCGVRVGGGPVAGPGGLACRVPFGVGGALVALAALYALRRWARAAGRGRGERPNESSRG
jgi:hypothetical protein